MKNKILLFRFSAFGDVAIAMPVLLAFKQAYPDKEIYFVSRSFAKDLVQPIEGIHFVEADFKGAHKGLLGLFRLFALLRRLGPWQLVADMHGVLRSHILSFLFALTGTKVSKISKGRKEKEALCRKEHKAFRLLKTSAQRYREVLVKGGFPFELTVFPGKKLYGSAELPSHVKAFLQAPCVGVAPFAKHRWKQWPEEKMLALLAALNDSGVRILLFGGGPREQDKLAQWSDRFSHAQSMVGDLTLAQELSLMSRLKVMITMDSANMHLASLVGTRVVSIWGATHPYAGFYGWGQKSDDAVQVDLACRPCSVFGNKPCHRGDFACMNRIEVTDVMGRLERL